MAIRKTLTKTKTSIKKRISKSSKAKKKISAGDFFSKVEKAAYGLYEKRGKMHGNDWEDWFTALEQVKKEWEIEL